MKKLSLILLSLVLLVTPVVAQESDADDPDAAAATSEEAAPPAKAKDQNKQQDKQQTKSKATAAAAKKDKKAKAQAAPAKPEPKGPFILIDAKSGEVLMESRSGEPYYPASLTKLMTGYLIFQKLRSGQLKPEQQLVVSELAHSQEPSKIGVPTGKTVTVDFALQALLVYSANDMAYVLAEGAAGSVPAFAAEMNATAKRLGLTASHFQNPNGLFDPRHVSSARDLAVLAAVIVAEFPEYQKYFVQPFLEVGKKRLPNRNILVRTMPEADGMKTGFVCASGFNLVATASRNGRRLIAVVMGMKSSAARAAAARAMLEAGFGMPPAPRRKVADITNLPQGAIVPVDMTSTVCRSKPPVTIQDGAELAGWAASFGTYDSADKAQMALRGRALSPAGLAAGGAAAVIELPDNSGYSPVIWGLDQGKSASVCAQYKQDGAHCDVLPAVLLDKIALLAKARKAAEAAQSSIEQGADADQKPVRRIGH
ncbi:MAG: D-alanyl-D-alanine carboxypeptidase [Rhizobiales bacterium]|nr:D-alanyl-D-alanine carboxypeptidase [Hyphomicrobiales bacterium]